MRPIVVSVSTQGVASAPIPLDIHIKPFSVSVRVDATGAGTTFAYNIEHTYDNVFSPTFDPATADWVVTSFSNVDAQVTYSAPVTAVRLNVTSIATTNTFNMTVIQAGLPG